MQPGRGEATRLMLKLNKIPFEDVTFGWDEWPKLKPSMPFGQVPVLEVDGQQLAQTAAIERYVAKLTGMYPDDPWQAAKGEELICFCVECFELFHRCCMPVCCMPGLSQPASQSYCNDGMPPAI
ncbi:uncharacterized protein HaLaN_14043, partial [Haematococcus lacustris]